MPNESDLFASIACNLDGDILSAAFPLLEEGRVEALEWAFDTLFARGQMPDWFVELLGSYGRENRLVGHGVFFSLLSGRWSAEQQQWLQQLRQLSAQFSFAHVTEHFGFFTGQDFHYGAPLPTPYTAATLRLGQDRLLRLYDACRCPVGLENLAFAYSLSDVQRQGAFLHQLLEPVNGFLILDLHNLYCQLHNFAVSPTELLALYPLEQVREIHISGGSWEDSVQKPGTTIRRDTHDGAVPEEVFRLLEHTMPRCPQLQYVVLEQLGAGLKTESSKLQFRQDFGRMEQLVQQHRSGKARRAATNPFLPLQPLPLGPAVEDAALYSQQQQLSQLLETASSFAEAHHLLHSSSLANTDWNIEAWEPHMLETAISIAQKWKK